MNMHNASRKRAASEFLVNGTLIPFDDPIIDARDALNAAGLTPASEFQIIMVEKGRTHLLGGEDKIVIADHPHADLRVFPGDRSYSFTVNEIDQVWGAKQMDTDEFYEIWPPAGGHDWVLERANEADIVLRPGSTLSFGPEGVEHIVARPHHGAEKLFVTVLTLSGVFPAEGALRVEATSLISVVLSQAAAALKLTDTSGWVLSAGGREINSTQTFAQAGLAETVEIDWIPREGGGGSA